MKSKHWAILLTALLLLCVVLSLWLLWPRPDAAQVQILSEGELLYTLDLSVDQELTVATDRGTNTITIQGGKIAVTAADCPDGYCMERGWCDGGTQIVCLPNRLVIRFLGKQPLDAVSG